MEAKATTTTPAVVRGLQLTNGSYLAAPTSVVSNLPVYVKGDYNGKTDSTGASLQFNTGAKDALNNPVTVPGTLNPSGLPTMTQRDAQAADFTAAFDFTQPARPFTDFRF